MTKKINSRAKGARGERQLAEWLRNRGHSARRGQQFSGSKDSPDVVCESLPDVHFECKVTQRTDLYGWLEQAARDAGYKLPVVAHKKNGEDWLGIVRLSDLLKLLEVFDTVDNIDYPE